MSGRSDLICDRPTAFMSGPVGDSHSPVGFELPHGRFGFAVSQEPCRSVSSHLLARFASHIRTSGRSPAFTASF